MFLLQVETIHPSVLRGRRGFAGVATSRRAIQSLRLRLHSGLRQSGRLLRSGQKPKAKALGYLIVAALFGLPEGCWCLCLGWGMAGRRPGGDREADDYP
jgi:hypothetical protein